MRYRLFLLVPVLLLFLYSCASMRKGTSRFDTSDSIYVKEEPEKIAVEVEAPPVDPAVVIREERVTHVEDSGPVYRYYVIIGSFRVLDNARNFRADLQRQQFNPVILENEEGLYRVSVAAYNDEYDARGRLSQIRREYEQYKDVWLLIRSR